MERELADLTPSLLAQVPVWEHIITGECDRIRAVPTRPLTSFALCMVGMTGHTTDGRTLFSLLSGISIHHPASNRHFVHFGLWHGAGWHFVPRYYDVGYDEEWLSRASDRCGFPIRLPVSYDLTPLGLKHPLQITLDSVPVSERLSMDDIIQMSVSNGGH